MKVTIRKELILEINLREATWLYHALLRLPAEQDEAGKEYKYLLQEALGELVNLD